MTIPHVGASLRESLEARARRVAFPDVRCARCRLSPWPRGWVVNLGICWTCLRPGDGTKDRRPSITRADASQADSEASAAGPAVGNTDAAAADEPSPRPSAAPPDEASLS